MESSLQFQYYKSISVSNEKSISVSNGIFISVWVLQIHFSFKWQIHLSFKWNLHFSLSITNQFQKLFISLAFWPCAPLSPTNDLSMAGSAFFLAFQLIDYLPTHLIILLMDLVDLLNCHSGQPIYEALQQWEWYGWYNDNNDM